MRWSDRFDSFGFRLFAAALLGAISVSAFAPLGWFPIIWLTLAGFFALLDRTASESTKACDGALIGGAFGSGFFLTGVSWIYVSLSTFGGMPMLTAGLATVIFCLGMAFYPALAGALFTRFAPSADWQRGLFFAALWTLSEWLRGWFLTGFPWLVTGYSQSSPSPLVGFAPLVGVYGISLLTVILAVCIYGVFRRDSARTGFLVGVILVLCGWLLHGQTWTTPRGEPIRVALMQGNISQDVKWRPEFFKDSLIAYYELMRDNPAQLTILPEAALPVLFHEIPRDYLGLLQEFAARENGDLLFGAVIGKDSEYTNSAINLGTSGMQRYDKSHLVPFGEFTPPGLSWFMAMVYMPMSDISPGVAVQAPMQIGEVKVAVNICYEDTFGEEIIQALPEADLLVNISNVAWFGDSLAPAQHLQIARMRALETGRMMLRATNTGMTAIIDADSSVRGVLPSYTRAALTGEVHAYTGSTPYVRWGNWPTIIICLILLSFARRHKALS